MTEHDQPLERTEVWASILEALETESLSAVAERFSVPPASIRAAQRRAGDGKRTRVVRPEKPADTLQSAPPKPEPAKASDDGDGDDASHPVHPHRHLLGTIPDGELGKRLGISMWVVRGYRLRAGIPAFDRWANHDAKYPTRKKKAEKPAATAKAAKAATAKSAPAAPSTRPVPARSAPSGTFAWRVTDHRGGQVVVVGSTLVEIARVIEQSGLDVARIDRIAPML